MQSPLDPDAVPPCIRRIHAALAEGKNVPHAGRRAFASFMMQMGVDEATIARQFSRSPNFDAHKTASQIKSLRNYLPQSCRAMGTDGLCTDEMQESLCRKIRNPVVWGRLRTGTIIPGPKVDDNENATFSILCRCGKLLGPIVGAKAAQALASLHFWQVPVEKEDEHSSMEYKIHGKDGGDLK